MSCVRCGSGTVPPHDLCTGCGAAGWSSLSGGPRPLAPAPLAPPAPPPSGPPVLAADAVVIEGAGGHGEVRPPRRLAFVATLGAVVGVSMLAGVGSLLVGGLSGSSGGADSPEQAVGELFEAIEGKDPLGVLATLSPTEVRSLGDVVQALQDHVDEAGHPEVGSMIDGIDLDIAYDDLAVTELSADAARVEVTGVEVTYAIDPSVFPAELGDALEAGVPDLSGSLSPDEGWGPLQVVAVRDGGGWYVSPLYSGIEAGLASAGMEPGNFAAAAQRPAPPADVDALMDQWVAAVEGLDVRAALDLLSFDALGVGHVYGEALDRVIASLEREIGAPLDEVARIEVEELEFSQRDDGDLVLVTVDRMRGSATVAVPGDGYTTEVAFSFDGTCYTAAWDGAEVQQCIDEGGPLRSQPVSVLVREDGGVRVSPMATIAYQAMAALESFDPSEALSFLGMSPLQPLAAHLQPDQPPAAHLQPDQRVAVDLGATDTVVVTFDAVAGQAVTLDVDAGDGASTSYEVWSPTSESLSCFDVCQVTETGTHRWVFTSWSSSGPVQVSFHVED